MGNADVAMDHNVINLFHPFPLEGDMDCECGSFRVSPNSGGNFYESILSVVETPIMIHKSK